MRDDALPEPGTMIVPKYRYLGSNLLYLVIAASETTYPGPWTQYRLMIVVNDRVSELESEKTLFHDNWHVLHRPR